MRFFKVFNVVELTARGIITHLVGTEVAAGHYAVARGKFPSSERRTAVAAQLFVVTARHEVLSGQAVGELSVGRYAQSIGESRSDRYRLKSFTV